MDRQLLVYEAIYGSSDADETIDDRLFTLLRLICEQTGKRVVVLVDEYDKPLCNHLIMRNCKRSIA